jgi:hypothetical protein
MPVLKIDAGLWFQVSGFSKPEALDFGFRIDRTKGIQGLRNVSISNLKTEVLDFGF